MEDLVVVGFTTAGLIGHVSKYGAEFKELAKHCATQIRPHYKSVRIVTETEFAEIQKREEDIRNEEYWSY